MSSSYKLKSHPTQSLYDHLTGVRDIALKTHKHHTIKPEIDDFIEIVCIFAVKGGCEISRRIQRRAVAL